MEVQKTFNQTESRGPKVQMYPVLPHAPFVWRQHGVAAVAILAAAALYVLAPADYASAMGASVMDNQNASFFRWIMMIAPLLLAFVRRGQPWWHTLACTGFALGYSGQVARMIYTDQVQNMPLALLIINLSIMGYYAVLIFRPSIYEKMDDQKIQIMKRDQENAELRYLLSQQQAQTARFKRLWMELGGGRNPSD